MCVCVCVRACVRASVRACVRSCVHVCVHACVQCVQWRVYNVYSIVQTLSYYVVWHIFVKILCANVDPDNTDVQIIDFHVEVAGTASVILTSDPP